MRRVLGRVRRALTRTPTARMSTELFRLWADGRIAPKVTETFAFADGGKAIAKMASRGAIGKLVVRVAE